MPFCNDQFQHIASLQWRNEGCGIC